VREGTFPNPPHADRATTEAATEVAAPHRRGRRAYLANLKVTLVILVILGHLCITYGDVGSWAYHEASDNEVFNTVTGTFVALGSLFAMGLFFLIAGMLTPAPLRRKGPGGFLRDRALRLGIPFLAYLILVYPLVELLADPSGGLSATFREQWDELDPGPLWFVGVLMLFSAAYVGWRALRPLPAEEEPGHGPLLPGHLVGLAAAIAAGTVLVRLAFPMNSGQPLGLHLWQWPQCLGLFALGVAAAERGWLDPVPTRMRRAGGWAALAAALMMMAAVVTAESFLGGLAWQALLTAACEGTVAVGFSLWLLGLFQSHFDHAGPLATAMGRAAFGAYVLQAPVLVAIAVTASDIDLAPEIKFLFVAPAAIAGSFTLSWLLTRLPGVRRVL